jgi:DNA-binding transcriptional ArsR family regulator
VSRQAAASTDDDSLDAIFSALSDRTRRQILVRLSQGPATVGELAAPFSISLPAVSKHLRILERAHLMRRERDGWYHHCHLVGEPFETASQFIDRYRTFWAQTLAQLARHLEPTPVACGRRRGKVRSRSR